MKQKLSLAFLMVLALFLVLTSRAQALGSGRVDGYAQLFLTGNSGQPVGSDVAIVPDMNGDGYDELAIGGSSAPNRVHVIPGGPDGWGLNLRLGTNPAVITYTGDAPGDLAGYTVAGVGDVNGDGFGDMLVGAPFNDIAGSNAGAVYVVLGSATLTGSNLGMFPTIVGEVANEEVGRTIGPAGDVNGDGYQDMLVGVMGHDTPATNAGAVYFVPGAATLTSLILNSTKIKYTGEATNDYAGSSVDSIGDMNGDGYMDFVVGAPQNDDGSVSGGAAYVVLGSATPTNGSLGTQIQYTGTVSLHGAGQEVTGAGDFNGDGYDDVMISASGAGAGVYLVLGSATPVSTLLSGAIFYSGAHGINTLTQAKYLAQAGDINADGFGDVLIGAEFENSNTGAVYVAYGTANPVNTTISSLPRLGGAAAGDLFGNAVKGNSDSNGDGLADIILSTLSNDEGGANAGGAYVLFGETSAQAYRERQRLNNTGNLPAILFDTIGIGVDFTANALAGGDVTVTRHLFHPCGTDIRLQTPIWTVDSPKIGAGTTFNLRLQYTTDQIVGMDENTLRVWTRPIGQPCAEWVQVGGSAVNVNTNLITATGLSSAGQYTVSASDTPPSPTAIQEQALAAYPAQSPAELMLILTILALSSGTTYTYLRRRQRHDDTRQKPGFLL